LSDLQLPADATVMRGVLARVREYAVSNKGPVARDIVAQIWRDVCDQHVAKRA
jgi:chorismate mutase